MEYAPARVIHVLAVVLWIGGVAMVTLVLLPSVRRLKSAVGRARTRPESSFRMIERLHWVLLSLSLVTVAAGVAGSHSWFWI